ncbi:C4b-binding protein beta chain [Sorex fumeus]|uniref:C4b-binding protein beta chain n=1 Tax=Sorex fumeus TaxID=62283 RepID=UPI0024ADFCEE|nr:C4b-binding protein beta chain [Sorex fumeus]
MICRCVYALPLMWLISASQEKSCPELPSVDNSIFVGVETPGHHLGTYICVKGYHLIGQKSLSCMTSQGWDAPTPSCRVGHCPDPVLENGEPSSWGPVHENDTVVFKCNDSYILKGSNWSQCQKDHIWAPPIPVCKSRDCDPPGKPSHGYFVGRDFSSGSRITYYCQERFRLVGTQQQRCVDGEWSSARPTCELVPDPLRTQLEEAMLAFQEKKDLCEIIKNVTQKLKESNLMMEEAKHFLELKKAELEAKLLKINKNKGKKGKNIALIM